MVLCHLDRHRRLSRPQGYNDRRWLPLSRQLETGGDSQMLKGKKRRRLNVWRLESKRQKRNVDRLRMGPVDQQLDLLGPVGCQVVCRS